MAQRGVMMSVGAAAAGACWLASDAFVASSQQASGAAAQQFLQQSTIGARAFSSSSSSSSTFASPAALAGSAGLVAVGAAALSSSGRKAVASKKTTSAICAIPKAMENTGGPMPYDVWDPIGLMEGKSEEQILHWRAVELKHGRVSMIAVLGWLHVASGWHFIGDAALGYRASDNPIINVQQMPMGAMWQMVFFFVCIEWLTAYVCKPPPGRPWDVLGWNYIIYDEEDKFWKERQLQEINNSRLAMVAILGLIGQTLATGNYGGWFAEPCFGLCKDGDPITWLKEGGNPLAWPLGPIGYPQIYPGQPGYN